MTTRKAIASAKSQYRGFSTAPRSGRRDRVEESGRALLDTPPFAKGAKGGAPRVEVYEDGWGCLGTRVAAALEGSMPGAKVLFLPAYETRG